jgi:Protein of unknown function (DUF1778)
MESSIIRLSRRDQIAFAKALLDPPAPNAKLLAAMRRHKRWKGFQIRIADHAPNAGRGMGCNQLQLSVQTERFELHHWVQ